MAKASDLTFDRYLPGQLVALGEETQYYSASAVSFAGPGPAWMGEGDSGITLVLPVACVIECWMWACVWVSAGGGIGYVFAANNLSTPSWLWWPNETNPNRYYGGIRNTSQVLQTCGFTAEVDAGTYYFRMVYDVQSPYTIYWRFGRGINVKAWAIP